MQLVQMDRQVQRDCLVRLALLVVHLARLVHLEHRVLLALVGQLARLVLV